MNLRIIAVAAVMGMLAATAGAQTTMDTSSPKMAAKSFAWAIEAGDAGAARKAATNIEPAHGQLIDAMAGMMAAYRNINDAAVKKFGVEGKGIMAEYPMAEVRMSKLVDEATITVDGDTAKLVEKGAEADDAPWVLRRVDGQWKVDMAGTLSGQKLKDAERSVHVLKAAAKAMADTAAEIAAGNYRTLGEAKEAVQKRMHEAAKSAQ